MSSPVRRELEEFLAGRGTPERVVAAVTLAFYRDMRGVQREALRPLINVIDRASPGIVELGRMSGGQGFEVRPAERPFPPEYVAALRQAAEEVVRGVEPPPPLSPPPQPLLPPPRADRVPVPVPEPRIGWVPHIEPSDRSRTLGPTARPPGLVSRILAAVRRLFSG